MFQKVLSVKSEGSVDEHGWRSSLKNLFRNEPGRTRKNPCQFGSFYFNMNKCQTVNGKILSIGYNYNLFQEYSGEWVRNFHQKYSKLSKIRLKNRIFYFLENSISQSKYMYLASSGNSLNFMILLWQFRNEKLFGELSVSISDQRPFTIYFYRI